MSWKRVFGSPAAAAIFRNRRVSVEDHDTVAARILLQFVGGPPDVEAYRVVGDPDPGAHPPRRLGYEPFIGSGTRHIAAEGLGRLCFGMELQPRFVAVTLKRIAEMGMEPRLAA
jgi:hypothetical protein